MLCIPPVTTKARSVFLKFSVMTQLHGTEVLQKREALRDNYWLKKDPIYQDRMVWRAQTFRHLMHLLPNQSILELGSGQGLFTEALARVSRGENPITAVSFSEEIPSRKANAAINFVSFAESAAQLATQEFDFIVAMDLVDASDSSGLLDFAYALLKPGGQLLLYESNPSNPLFRINQLLSKMTARPDTRQLHNKLALETLVTNAGFESLMVAYHDFTYAPLTSYGYWLLRNASVLLENMPYVQTMSGSLLVHARKGAHATVTSATSLADHRSLYGAISVVVPCHNEEMNLPPLVSQLLALYSDYIKEIVLVDDNSTDHTWQVISRLYEEYSVVRPVRRSPPNGVGRALMDGYREATGEYILSMDCDFQHLLPELRDIFDAAAEGFDMVIGSRFSRYSVLVNYPFQKIVANRAFHLIARMLLNTRFRDVTNNLKLVRRTVIQNVLLTQPGFSINAETGLLPILMNYSVKEVPISWINRTADMGVSSFKLAKVGGGYWQVLRRLWVQKIFGSPKPKPFPQLSADGV